MYGALTLRASRVFDLITCLLVLCVASHHIYIISSFQLIYAVTQCQTKSRYTAQKYARCVDSRFRVKNTADGTKMKYIRTRQRSVRIVIKCLVLSGRWNYTLRPNTRMCQAKKQCPLCDQYYHPNALSRHMEVHLKKKCYVKSYGHTVPAEAESSDSEDNGWLFLHFITK